MADITLMQFVVGAAGVIILLGNVVAAVALLVKFPSRWLDKRLNDALNDNLAELRRTMGNDLDCKLEAKLEAKIQPLRKDLTTNGGSSLKDRVLATFHRVDSMSKRMDDIKGSADEAHHRIDDMLRGRNP